MKENKIDLKCTINEKKYDLSVPPMLRLIDIIRDIALLKGTKEGCGEGECGSCLVIFNDKIVNSCLITASQLQNSKTTTIEGIVNTDLYKAIEKAFIKKGGAQCGFCTPGMIMATYNLLTQNLKPSKNEIKFALSGNLCRCTGYTKITESVLDAIKNIGAKN
jgi:aerobic carbon-monoxide dehydrogenase small subunit